MPAALPTSAATGGLVAALVSNYLSSDVWLNPAGSVAPLCQELVRDTTWHVPSLLIGVILGIFLAQLLDLLYLARQSLVLYVRQRSWGSYNAGLIKARIA